MICNVYLWFSSYLHLITFFLFSSRIHTCLAMNKHEIFLQYNWLFLCIYLFLFNNLDYLHFLFKNRPNRTCSSSLWKIFFHFLFGNWLAINIYFNYTMACLTSPGFAKNYQNLAIHYPICKKYSLFKPPRTHH